MDTLEGRPRATPAMAPLVTVQLWPIQLSCVAGRLLADDTASVRLRVSPRTDTPSSVLNRPTPTPTALSCTFAAGGCRTKITCVPCDLAVASVLLPVRHRDRKSTRLNS